MKVLMAWSGGKDSALALHRVGRMDGIEVAGLLTTVTLPYDRITMHGVRRELLLNQAASLGIPLLIAEIQSECSNELYDQAMGEALGAAASQAIEAVAFGDVFLEEVRRYREERLERLDLEPIFPLWGEDSSGLAREFIDLGFRAVITCVDTEMLEGSFAGRDYDLELLAELPPGVDPCGENGEFHSFVWDGPHFARSIAFERGPVELREGRFNYQDLLPGA